MYTKMSNQGARKIGPQVPFSFAYIYSHHMADPVTWLAVLGGICQIALGTMPSLPFVYVYLVLSKRMRAKRRSQQGDRTGTTLGGVYLTDSDIEVRSGWQSSRSILALVAESLDIRDNSFVALDKASEESEVRERGLSDTTDSISLDLVNNVEASGDYGASRSAPAIGDNRHIRSLPWQSVVLGQRQDGPSAIKENPLCVGLGMTTAPAVHTLGVHGDILESLSSGHSDEYTGIKDGAGSVLDGDLGGTLDVSIRRCCPWGTPV
ncbi:MAG: hypothetical protein J3Q66DRAFT_124994 [Benniella sp.]|nr:MAG: hypothetical protein J3Q66DRAFT_124994 [Benniella sp.]